jgi:hypothetical protein
MKRNGWRCALGGEIPRRCISELAKEARNAYTDEVQSMSQHPKRQVRTKQLVEQHCIRKSDPRYSVIDEAAFKSKNVYNAALYEMRQAFIHHGV